MPHQVGFRYGHRIFCRIGFFLSDGVGILDSVFVSNIDFGNSDKLELLEKFALSEINRTISQGMGRGSGFRLLRRQVGMYWLQLEEVWRNSNRRHATAFLFEYCLYALRVHKFIAQTWVLSLSGNEAGENHLESGLLQHERLQTARQAGCRVITYGTSSVSYQADRKMRSARIRIRRPFAYRC